eukprot:TRINITY_DN10471_c1_g2_i1.p1 TRINITY_DN10471_c1_g2~~TRINITY_DN10471_c1_g2_i1.p1  ORF type:complete len:510 (-),score=75.43 TRINITY_DN10471_c1_g2_i1:327-1856(-)
MMAPQVFTAEAAPTCTPLRHADASSMELKLGQTLGQVDSQSSLGFGSIAPSCINHSKPSSYSDWEQPPATKGATRASHSDRSLSAMLGAIDPHHATKRLFGGAKPGAGCAICFADFMHKLTEHIYFDIVFGICIILNAMFMAYEAEHALTAPAGAALPRAAEVLGKCFTGAFVLELILRMCGGLHRFFFTYNAWNYFDFCIVSLSVVDEFIEATASLSNTRMLRLLRLTRTVKVLRMVRIVRVVSALRTLVNSLVGTMRQVIWAFCLIACLIFVFAVNFGQLVGHARAQDVELGDDHALITYWGTVTRCMYTLFMTVTGGISWRDAALPLEDLGPAVVIGFLLYVALIQWVVLNVITGCFCESASEAARKDVSLAIQAYRADRDRFLHHCKTIFRSIDIDCSGLVRGREMRRYLDSEPARALFSALEIDVEDAYGLFELLDKDGSNGIDVEEFMRGCMQIRGGAKALGIAQIQCQNKHMTKMLETLIASVKPQSMPQEGPSGSEQLASM